MSQYTQFFLRNKDVFLPIATYSRSNKIAEIFQYAAPYESIRPVTFKMLREVREVAQSQLNECDNSIARAKEQIEFLCNCTMEADERIEHYNSAVEFIEDVETCKKQCAHAISFIGFLEDVLEEAETERKWGENPLQLNEDSYVYVGIEVGTPTIEDIKD